MKNIQAPPLIEKDLAEVRKIIEEHLVLEHQEISDALLALQRGGGKMLRPSLLLYFARLGNRFQENRRKILYLAASVEILHMATLIHDDIIDDAPLRRGCSSIQSRFGKDVAVYTGDFLFTIYFELLAKSGDLGEYFSVNARAMKNILLGELDQMSTRFKTDISLEEYFQTITGKTAELFALSARLGAYFGGMEKENVLLAEKIGYNIGLCFQILDDILDYTSSEKELKKPVLEDLLKGVYTAPLILALPNSTENLQKLLERREKITAEERKNVQQLVLNHGGVTESKKLATHFSEKALADIEQLPNGEVKKILLKMVKELLRRSH
ncbi:heptaprenyl diphosphate synthase [Pilibacter termitis]|uniref:Heptaprenyl diphosphate synthase n=1 Tax=Pilibacter termitis TaxID=263852 RepID=A0A1T4RE52_9ENTE|nr:polyprenyl synthetase family protein [Pilibacter termitis]SKA14189.1 heptaprenyl diphosphate synthase [Pilibacter termitis]